VLAYEVPKALPMQEVADAMVRMTGRLSVHEWRRRCEASLRASRARRAGR